MNLVQIDGITIKSQHRDLSVIKKLALVLIIAGLFFLLVSLFITGKTNPYLIFLLSVGLFCTGSLTYISALTLEEPAGIKHNGIMTRSLTARGVAAWLLAIFLTTFYILLYWFPNLLENWIRLMDPLALMIMGQAADQWFLYGTFYTLAVFIMGIYMICYKDKITG